MTKTAKTMDSDYKVVAYFALKQAKDFKRIAELAYDNQLSFPYMVNIAFACELYMKAYLIWTRKSDLIIRNHLLADLFHMIDSNTQNRIRAEADIQYWDTFLSESSDAFRQWRYYFEKDTVLFGHVGALHRFADASDTICSEQIIVEAVTNDSETR